MVELIQIESGGRQNDIQPLFAAYADWLKENIQRELSIQLDSNEMVQSFMAGIEKFYSPQGCLHLARQNGDFVGVGCLKVLEGELGEIKRMYVREEEYAHLVIYMELDLRNTDEHF